MSKEQQIFLCFYVAVWTVLTILLMVRLCIINKRLTDSIERLSSATIGDNGWSVKRQIEKVNNDFGIAFNRIDDTNNAVLMLADYLGVEYVTTPEKTELKKIKK